MPRSNRPRRSRSRPGATPPGGAPLDPVRALGGQQRVAGPDGEWLVRTVTGQGATKDYLCPGCHQRIAPGVPHVVAWRTDAVLGPDAALADRRHWHRSCFGARGTRAPR